MENKIYYNLEDILDKVDVFRIAINGVEVNAYPQYEQVDENDEYVVVRITFLNVNHDEVSEVNSDLRGAKNSNFSRIKYIQEAMYELTVEDLNDLGIRIKLEEI